MKLNNKGFAISGLLYPIFILFIILILGVLGNLATSKAILDLTNREIEQELNGENVNPVITFNGDDITVSNGYSYSLIDDVTAKTYDDKEISKSEISYVSEPLFDNTKNGDYYVTYTVSDQKGRTTTKTRIVRVDTLPTYAFSYTGTSQTITNPTAGTFQVELWGARGGSSGGSGGYTKGIVELSSNEIGNTHFFVGQGGVTTANATSYNGGTASGGGYPGGGATDMRVLPTNSYRYIRDYINGSSVNTGNHWVEIQVFSGGTNIALGKTVTGYSPQDAARPYTRIVDNDLTSANYAQTTATGLQYVEIDLGAEYPIDYVKVYHYYTDTRTYNETKTILYNADRSIEYDIHDSLFTGTYAEAATGKQNDYNYWKIFDSLKTRIMVAAGGGASGVKGGAAGGLTGLNGVNDDPSYPSTYEGFGGTQTAAGVSTYGATTSGFGYSNGGCSGGGGYYGGGGATCANGSGGGSSFISGHTGANAINASSIPGAITHLGISTHYSGIIFNNTSIIAGNASMPNPAGGTMTGNSSNGYARITQLIRINS